MTLLTRAAELASILRRIEIDVATPMFFCSQYLLKTDFVFSLRLKKVNNLLWDPLFPRNEIIVSPCGIFYN